MIYLIQNLVRPREELTGVCMLRGMPTDDLFEVLSAVNISCSMGSTWQVQNNKREAQL